MQQSTEAPRTAARPARSSSFAQFARGGRLYRENCSGCHGNNGEGAPNWRRRGPDGRFPAPPLNGSGHAWHHPKEWLHRIIKKGSPNGGKMPPWGQKLTDAEIDAIIAWFQSKWPEKVYAVWQ